MAGSGEDQIHFTGVSSCEAWVQHKFKPEACKECGHRFSDHRKEAVSERDISEYILVVASKNPYNLIIPSTEAMGGLYLGSCGAATPEVAKELNIKGVCQTAWKLEEFYPSWGAKLRAMESAGEVEVFRTDWVDAISQQLLRMREACQFIDGHRRRGGSVLVNCAQGKSRSSSLVIGYLLWSRTHSSYEEALADVKSKRGIAEPNPGFEKQLRAFEKELGEEQ